MNYNFDATPAAQAQQDFVPLLIGADMNAYSVARALHEQYGVVSHALGRFAAGDTKYSRIVQVALEPNLEDLDTLLARINEFATAHADKKVLVWGCTDGYAAMLMELRDKLPANCRTLYIDAELRDKLEAKDSFYQMCDQYGIPYPTTQVVTPQQFADGMTEADLAADKLGFEYPIIVKPSMSEEYWRHPFDGMKKVYSADTPAEALRILGLIFGAGYPMNIILQDTVPGSDDSMRVLTAYSDRNGKVKMMCFGRVGLEEHTATALGNPCAIITEPNPELQARIKAWLEGLHFTGFSNFDIKYDSRDGGYKVFEINLRQGRSNFYITGGAGINIARYVVEDRIYERDLGECYENENEGFYRSVPRKVVREYVQDPEFVRRANELIAKGKDAVSFYYSPDLRFNPVRWAYVKVHMYRYFDKFKNSEKYK